MKTKYTTLKQAGGKGASTSVGYTRLPWSCRVGVDDKSSDKGDYKVKVSRSDFEMVKEVDEYPDLS